MGLLSELFLLLFYEINIVLHNIVIKYCVTNLYNQNGASLFNGLNMAQTGSAVIITGDASSTKTLLDCNALEAGWRKSDRQYAYSTETYNSSDTIRIDFNNADPALDFQDMAIGFGDADNYTTGNPTFQLFGDGTSTHLNSIDNFYFFLSQNSVNTQTFTITYDGNGNLSRYTDGVLIDTTPITFNTYFPNGLKIYAVFNNGGSRSNYHYKVNLFQSITYPARTILCKSMGKKYVLNNKTYIKVQNVSDQTNFYINADDKVFASFNF